MKQFPVAVIIEKKQLDNRWVSEKWEAIGVVPAFDAPVDAPPRQIFADEQRAQFLAGHFPLELFRDEVDNYHLNLTSPEPRVFVMWRMDEGFAKPMEASLSYGEAARWLDSGEQCDGVPMPPEIADWLGDFVNTHYKPAVRTKIKRNDPFAGKRRP
ncbi:DUF3305 domain-containing protein [Dechloromonas hortensis]|uniref:DUF3305 domain-containing protein n=1 Tax=Dechloromonas hortensis TaxID=337779 RepID=UPI0012908E81|nr:DUF3305 domain-containing protein [Dechloromonas hortensis]